MIRLLGEIELDKSSNLPLYVQLSTAILKFMDQGLIGEGGLLPSITKLAWELDISFNTVEKAYGVLKKQGMVTSMHGKGFSIARTSYYPCKYLVVLLKGHIPCTVNVGSLLEETNHTLLVDVCADIAKVIDMPQDALAQYQKFFIVSENGVGVLESEEMLAYCRQNL